MWRNTFLRRWYYTWCGNMSWYFRIMDLSPRYALLCVSFCKSKHGKHTPPYITPREFCSVLCCVFLWSHDDVIKWKHFPRYWPFVRGIHWSPVNSPHKCQWHGALMFTLICVWMNDWVNNRQAGDLRGYRSHYDVIVMGTFRFYPYPS